MRRRGSTLITAAAITGFAVGVGLLLALTGVLGLGSGGSDDGADGNDPAADRASLAPVVTSLADVDTASLSVARASFCDRIPTTLVAAALGTDPVSAQSYGDGDRADITDRTTDVAHEFDCSWTAGAGAQQTSARAWVFAPPVTGDQATRLVRQQRQAAYCKPLTDAATFGSPSIGSRCHTRQGLQVTYRGLFGDAWLACSVTARDKIGPLTERADQWCATVALAASTSQ